MRSSSFRCPRCYVSFRLRESLNEHNIMYHDTKFCSKCHKEIEVNEKSVYKGYGEYCHSACNGADRICGIAWNR